MKTDIVVPEWLKLVADDGCVTANEIYQMFGYSCAGAVSKAALKGAFPASVLRSTVTYSRPGRSGRAVDRGKCHWRKSDVIKEVERRRALGENS